MASTHKNTQSMLQPYIKALSAYGRTLPTTRGASSPSLRPTGVAIRNKEPNVEAPKLTHPSGRPPAEHIVKMIVGRMTSGVKYKPSVGVQHFPKSPTIHPGKALALKQVKSIHLGSHTAKKVVL